MKPTGLLIVVVVHAIGFCIAAFVIHALKKGDPGLALVAGAICGAQAAAVMYHRRNPARAPFSAKASAGVVLSVMAVVAGVASQHLLGWFAAPEVVITVSSIGSFMFPFVLFGSIQRAYARQADSPSISRNDA